jgi:hypothetical protein
MSHVEMRHPDTGHVARIAKSAVTHAVTRGWEPVDEQHAPDTPAPEPDVPAQEPAESGGPQE